MRHIFLAMLVLLITPTPSVESFAGINLDVDTKRGAYAKLENKGYEKVQMFGTTCHRGSIVGVNAYVVIPDDGGEVNMDKVVQVITVIFMPDDNSAYTTYTSLNSDYNTIKKAMVSKYGESKSLNQFSRPYENGDGYELTALKVGKLFKTDIWEDLDKMIISMNATKSCIFQLLYASKKSMAEYKKKEQETAGDL